ncbi:MAG: hypothetical protein WC753_04590 [Candidatus Gracilibacteria bacterium]|jgi:hypothetical protein
MSIGRGWYLDDDPPEEYKTLSSDLLKTMISRMFEIRQENKNNERMS